MLTMRDHGVEDYADLRDMDATDVGVLADDDRACLTELGEYLVSADAWQRFSIWLLHKHFEPADGELFVESVITQPRRLQTALVDQSDVDVDTLHPTAMRFDDSVERGLGVVGMEFSPTADLGATSPISDDDEAVLAGIEQRLRARAKTNRFGVKLVRDPLELAPTEVLLETCDFGNRVLSSDVTGRSEIAPNTFIETVWNFRPAVDGADRIVMQDCNIGCFSEPTEGHTLAHGQGAGDDHDD
ncbi:hypothetical protein H7K45_27445 [Mycobacterium yunnanensis]|uniref:Uncharacterized protein n=1 Tax=Mycobacterium yunnanensis TaxID=368477 RepID=A0A9X2Z7A9_9MYCO|nr:hypothetical protein [Mycobacterium yunnanensis]MCV7424293.1 hypothetical protein [Mycobacterium yunnanensis]